MSEKKVLTEVELNAFGLRCLVCGDPIPWDRARRRKDTCSVEHFDLVKQWRKHLMYTRKCHACHAPYSLKQREEFRRWRQSTGQLEMKSGRPPISRERKLSEALASAVAALEMWQEIAQKHLPPEWEIDLHQYAAERLKATKKAVEQGRRILNPPVLVTNDGAETKEVDAPPAESDIIATNP